MPTPAEPHHPNNREPVTGRHRLGPHVVGQRVVVRRLLRGETGPSGGPALSDVLGVCTAWSEGVCVVEPSRGGDPVEVPIADIVSGKPVPRRPSVRHRVSAYEAELHTASLFPGVRETPLGEWRVRWQPTPEGRPRKRANSCLAMGSPGLPVADALAEVAAIYGGLGRPPLVQVEQGSGIEGSVAAAGWRPVPGGDAAYLITSVAMLRRSLRGTEGPVQVDAGPFRATATVGDGSGELARARAGLDGDWLGVHDVYVDQGRRRQGLGRELMGALLEWGAEQGARTVWLHVETDNRPALAFYDALGFGEHHRCRYYGP